MLSWLWSHPPPCLPSRRGTVMAELWHGGSWPSCVSGRKHMQEPRAASIPNPYMWPQSQVLSWAGPRLGIRDSDHPHPRSCLLPRAERGALCSTPLRAK